MRWPPCWNCGQAVHNREGSVGRAAGAQLTGQRQDGPSQGPACEQYPRVAHGGAGSFAAPLRRRADELERALLEMQRAGFDSERWLIAATASAPKRSDASAPLTDRAETPE